MIVGACMYNVLRCVLAPHETGIDAILVAPESASTGRSYLAQEAAEGGFKNSLSGTAPYYKMCAVMW